jgi:eukaryotic-like serine/threonine-protein kinase
MKLLTDRELARLQVAMATGELLAGRYRIREPLGYGGMSSVYLAHDELLDRDVALKIMDFVDPAADRQQVVATEARLLARLEHPGVVPVHDLGHTPEGGVFYVMKRIAGQTFESYCAHGASLSDRIRVLQRVCETLAFAHARGIVHRDLTPANVMVAEFGEVLILDWGIAVHSAESAPSPESQQVIAGTPGYVAPELRNGGVKAVTAAADIFALGGLLLFAIGGRPGEDANALRSEKEVAPLAAVARKARAPAPLERYASVLAFSDDLTRFLASERVVAYREPWYETVSRWVLKYQFLVSLLLAYLLMRAAIALMR